LHRAGLTPARFGEGENPLGDARWVVDALIGYGLRGAPRGRAAAMIQFANREAHTTISLDVPSGLDATTGETPGRRCHPEATVTLALPKAGLGSVPGDVILADIGIPPEVYSEVGIDYEPPFGHQDHVIIRPARDARATSGSTG
jgi:NAD(P)H-hydrate epimerase